eukprot:6983519-Heterocapsa_arctica.AAC.1
MPIEGRARESPLHLQGSAFQPCQPPSITLGIPMMSRALIAECLFYQNRLLGSVAQPDRAACDAL